MVGDMRARWRGCARPWRANRLVHPGYEQGEVTIIRTGIRRWNRPRRIGSEVINTRKKRLRRLLEGVSQAARERPDPRRWIQRWRRQFLGVGCG